MWNPRPWKILTQWWVVMTTQASPLRSHSLSITPRDQDRKTLVSSTIYMAACLAMFRSWQKKENLSQSLIHLYLAFWRKCMCASHFSHSTQERSVVLVFTFLLIWPKCLKSWSWKDITTVRCLSSRRAASIYQTRVSMGLVLRIFNPAIHWVGQKLLSIWYCKDFPDFPYYAHFKLWSALRFRFVGF